MNLFNSKLQKVFIRKDKDGTHFEIEMLDCSWTEVLLCEDASFTVRFHNEIDDEGNIAPYRPKGEDVSHTFRKDPESESLLVKHLFTAAQIADGEVLAKLLFAVDIWNNVQHRLEDPSESDPAGYTDPISPIPVVDSSARIIGY